MKISIITVCFNSYKTIEQTIVSVLSQKYPNIEYIIIDGGSVDGTLEIIKKYSCKIDKIISEPDSGMYDALNKGIKSATGDIVGILNSDDEYTSEYVIQKVIDRFNTSFNIDAVFGDVRFIKNSITTRYYRANNWKPSCFKYGNMPPHPTFFCKKKYFGELGDYKTNYRIAGDFELLLRFIFINKIKYEYIPLCMVNMKVGGLSTSGLKSLFRINYEILNAFEENKLRTNYIYLYSRYFKKVFQFLY